VSSSRCSRERFRRLELTRTWRGAAGELRPGGGTSGDTRDQEEAMSSLLLDAAGRRRAPGTLPGNHRGRPPRNKGLHYPADPPTVEEIITVMRQAGDRIDGDRLRALIVFLWRSGLRSAKRSRYVRAILTPAAARVSFAAAKAESAAKSASTTGAGNNFSPGSPGAPACRSAACSASSTVSPADARGRRRPSAPSSDTSPPRPACDDGSPRISCATPTRLRWPAKGCH
jgi:hypothetical protein